MWLYIRRYNDGKINYAFSNAPADTRQDELDQASRIRLPIKQCFEECKSHLGMGHCEARSWQAWHRHMLYVFIALLFVLELRLMFKKNANFDHAPGKKIDHSIFD